jgi:hypothetical protein
MKSLSPRALNRLGVVSFALGAAFVIAAVVTCALELTKNTTTAQQRFDKVVEDWKSTHQADFESLAGHVVQELTNPTLIPAKRPFGFSFYRNEDMTPLSALHRPAGLRNDYSVFSLRAPNFMYFNASLFTDQLSGVHWISNYELAQEMWEEWSRNVAIRFLPGAFPADALLNETGNTKFAELYDDPSAVASRTSFTVRLFHDQRYDFKEDVSCGVAKAECSKVEGDNFWRQNDCRFCEVRYRLVDTCIIVDRNEDGVWSTGPGPNDTRGVRTCPRYFSVSPPRELVQFGNIVPFSVTGQYVPSTGGVKTDNPYVFGSVVLRSAKDPDIWLQGEGVEAFKKAPTRSHVLWIALAAAGLICTAVAGAALVASRRASRRASAAAAPTGLHVQLEEGITQDGNGDES